VSSEPIVVRFERPPRPPRPPRSNGRAVPTEASWGGAIFAALPDFIIAGLFVYTWLHPMGIHPQMVKRLVGVIALEFIVVHSAPFTGLVASSDLPWPKRIGALVGLGALYMLFAWGFSAAVDSSWPMIAFFALMLNRMLGVVIGAVPSDAQKYYMASCWIVGAIAYLGATFATVAAPLPSFGITPAVIAAQHFTVGGEWPEQPYRAIALGALYFTIVGIWQIAALPLSLRLARNS
jgi:hypothetical protein